MSKKSATQVAKDVIGLSEAQADALIQAAGYSMRVTSIDGIGQMGTCDYRLNRINLSIDNNIVTAANVG